MSRARFIVADVFDGLASLEPGSIDLVLSSPPFLALRSYLPPDHPTKAKEIGSEPTPADFIDTLLDVVEACDRVLAPHGSLVFELGDTYSGSGGAGGDYAGEGMRNGQPRWDGSAARTRVDGNGKVFRGGARQPDKAGSGWPLDKSLTGIPTLFAWSLAYGRNLLRPERTTEPWRIRNLIAWCRSNPAVGALSDKCRPATSYITVATKSGARYWDMDAVRTEAIDQRVRTTNGRKNREGDASEVQTANYTARVPSNPAGAPLLDWWGVPTQPSSLAHFAMWPEEIARRLILLMCPERVCRTCGEPSRRVVGAYSLDAYRHSDRPQTRRAVELADAAGLTDEHIAAVRAFGTSDAGKAQVLNTGAGRNSERVKALAAEAKAVLGGYFLEFVMRTNAQPGSTWTDCGHDDWRRGVALDPFAGSGTTLQVAARLGRDSVGIDINEANAELARKRVSGFGILEVVGRDGSCVAQGQEVLL